MLGFSVIFLRAVGSAGFCCYSELNCKITQILHDGSAAIKYFIAEKTLIENAVNTISQDAFCIAVAQGRFVLSKISPFGPQECKQCQDIEYLRIA